MICKKALNDGNYIMSKVIPQKINYISGEMFFYHVTIAIYLSYRLEILCQNLSHLEKNILHILLSSIDEEYVILILLNFIRKTYEACSTSIDGYI